jgi:hypothetical protein
MNIIIIKEQLFGKLAETTIVTGWGGGGQEVHNHQILQKVSVPVTEKQLCRDLFGDDFKHGMICAGVLEGNRDACPGIKVTTLYYTFAIFCNDS